MPTAQNATKDAFVAPSIERTNLLLALYWQTLRKLPPLLTNYEHLRAQEQTSKLRQIVLEMMLALNGIQPPQGHLNDVLSASQKEAIHKTMLVREISSESWVGQAVALTVIYRWYAPQLAEKYALDYPQALEDETWAELRAATFDWPQQITTS